jgi:hypothetical protein
MGEGDGCRSEYKIDEGGGGGRGREREGGGERGIK